MPDAALLAAQRVYVVDDDPGVLRALARLLQSAGHAVAAYPSPVEFLDRYDAAAPGCLVLDVAMPGLDGLAVQRRLKENDTTLAIVFVSGHGDIPCSVQAMKAGAVDFLTKPFDDVALLGAVEAGLQRSRLACRDAFERRVLRERLALLTAREREVLNHVVSGRLNKLIASDLGAAEKTIKVHRARVMQKMGATSLAELVRMAERAGISPSA